MAVDEEEQMGMGMVMDSTGDFFGDYSDLENGDIDMQTNVPSLEISDDEDEEDDGFRLDDKNGWEPAPEFDPRAPSPDLIFEEGHFDETLHLPHSRPPPPSAPNCIRQPHVIHYPDPNAGAPILSDTRGTSENFRYSQKLDRANTNPWAPFVSEIDWKIAHWAKMRGPSSTAFSELLAIDGVAEKLGLSYHNMNALNAVIDNKLPNVRPQFKRQEVVVQCEVFEVYFRDVLECTKALFGDAEFAEYLKYSPERHFENDTGSEQLYHDMHTGSWWWLTQKKLDKNAGPGRTVLPVIISSDKTQVTVFRNKSVYPVYMSIGNIPKEIRRKPSRRAYILLGYLPTTNLSHIKNAASRRRSIANLFHTCMRHIMKPLEVAGARGMTMTSGDGFERLCHPIFVAHIGDYPEQILVTCCITGRCPSCTVPREQVGKNTEPHPFRDLRSILEALTLAEQGSSAAFVEACRAAGIKPIFEPYWAKLPYSNVYLAITPDILHQLYQGVFKHLKNWILEAYGAHEIDARCRRLPPNHNIQIFMKGISNLQRVSGAEHAQMSHFFLGLIAEAPLPSGMSSSRLVKCLRGLLDYLFLAQYPVHSSSTLNLISDALERFHDNKQIFIDLGIRSHFQIPKIHFMNHYVESIKRMGTPDNFNTEYTELLHIDLAKDAYDATNKKDELSQMTKWLERKEKVMKHASYVCWRQSATFFKAALARFVIQLRRPDVSGSRLDDEASGIFLGVSHVSVYHRIKYIHQDFFTQVSSTDDSIHVQPAQVGKYGKIVPARFDTALIRITDSNRPQEIMSNTRVARVRLVFTLPDKITNKLFADVSPDSQPLYLAYVEWFTPFSPSPDPNHRLHKISHCEVDGGRLASVVDIHRLVRSVHLFPKFGHIANCNWTSSSVLDECKTFFVNLDSDRHMYQLFTR
ncbi:hypothetical protein DFJ43DRAFT_1037221 [Lentinula guzmanii]|uniref:Zn-finger domain-containing protein n=1 Tax=Lentinula guzmanii TaxID=2804957 RepID=A0AA38JQP1_9AGAR|nr:hypothetical protein DFJ43DRAFT_1037221 [Lentinula guzmanii]